LNGEHDGSIYHEYPVQNETEGFPLESTLLVSSLGKAPQARFLKTPATPHCGTLCYILEASDVDIEQYCDDLVLLQTRITLGGTCIRASSMDQWLKPAQLIVGYHAFCHAQGWWHQPGKVVVVCLLQAGAIDLYNKLTKLVTLGHKKIGEYKISPKNAEQIFLHAFDIIRGDATLSTLRISTTLDFPRVVLSFYVAVVISLQ